jgi:Concanavalin A-like lectin/glucanases superfamily
MSLQNSTIRLVIAVGSSAGLAAMLLIAAASSATAAVTHQYTFNDGTANDSVGAANGTFIGGLGVTLDGQADLDGVDDYVSLPGGTIAINTYTNVTLEGWFTMDAAPAWQRLYDFGDTNPENLGRNYIFYSPSSGPGDHRAVISDADPGFNSEELAAGGPTLATGIEHHIAVTISNGGSMTLFHNGAQVGTVPLTKSLATVSNAFALLGEATYPGDPNFNGRIDEFRIHDAALTAPQVQASFNTGQNFKPTVVVDVNTMTGAVQLRNATAAPLTFDQYQITSASGSLNLAGWNSLSDQNINSTGAGAGQSWDEAGAPSANVLSELFLLGDTTLAPGAALSLGNAYNTSAAGNDLRFQYSLTDGTIARSAVNYASSVIDADFDNSGTVDGRDLLLWQRNLGTNAGATNGQGDSDGNGAVNAADLANWKARFGGPSAVAAAGAIPEPAAAVLIATSALAVFWGRPMRRSGADAVR